jgi:pyruvate/2-oxoglutarate/acetoin dehydrogenase E1 component
MTTATNQTTEENAAYAKGFLKTAIRDEHPVVFFEDKMLYKLKGPVPAGDYAIPLGVADIKRVAVIAEGAFYNLEAPVKRLSDACADSFLAAARRRHCPDRDTVFEDARALCGHA